MKYNACKHYYISQSIIPVGWLVIVTWLTITQGKDIESILLVAAIALAIMTIFIYSLVKQVKTPLVITDDDGILIQNVWRAPEKAAWALVVRIKKYPILGYKLETLGRNIWLPLGMLTRDDAQKLLQEVKEQVNKKA